MALYKKQDILKSCFYTLTPFYRMSLKLPTDQKVEYQQSSVQIAKQSKAHNRLQQFGYCGLRGGYFNGFKHQTHFGC